MPDSSPESVSPVPFRGEGYVPSSGLERAQDLVLSHLLLLVVALQATQHPIDLVGEGEVVTQAVRDIEVVADGALRQSRGSPANSTAFR